MEHYCTLFDLGFLPQGLALHASLRRHANPFTLWILCLDVPTQEALENLGLGDVRILALADCETPELSRSRSYRTYGEYCWTLASQLFSFVFDRDDSVRRLTYIDADVYFFGSPREFISELESSGKTVLITEHAFAPKFSHYAEVAGRYCVQFVTFSRVPESLALLARWQGQTLESCSGAGGGRGFGDQQYLDEWPQRYPHLVHVLDHRFRTLAPWNVDHALEFSDPGDLVLFHFHSFRILSSRWLQWCLGYSLNHPSTLRLYAAYQTDVLAAIETVRRSGARFAFRSVRPGARGWLGLLRSWLRGRLLLRRLPQVIA